MTLIIGVKCRDGIVIGADSISTFGTDIEQEVSNKIEYLAEDSLIGSAGAVGLSQLIKERLRDSWETVRGQENKADARSEIQKVMWAEVRSALVHAEDASDILGQKVFSSALCSSLLAFPFRDEHVLLSYNQIAQSEEITCEAPFKSIGSGSLQADPFLAFLKRIFWKDSAPEKTTDGVLSILWTLDHVSRVNAGLGVGGRPNVFILSKGQDAWLAERLDEYYLREQLLALEAAEGALRSFRDRFNPKQSNNEDMQ